jgi:hypothetical protein
MSLLPLLLSASLCFAQDAPYTTEEMAALQQAVDEAVGRGRFFQAAEKLRGLKRERIPEGALAKVQDAERRVGGYASLLLETTSGDTAAVPALTRIAIKGGGKPLGRIFREDATFYYYETLTGIRSRVAKEQVETLTALTKTESATEVLAEFRRQCGNRSLILQTDAGKPPAWKEVGGKKITGGQVFALAEFASRNGAGEFLPGLFDLCVARDPNIRGVLHVAKSERLVNQLFYSLTINQLPQANYALDALTGRYRDTAAYRDKLHADKDIHDIVQVLLKKTIPPPQQASLLAKAPADPVPPAPGEKPPAETAKAPQPPPPPIPDPLPLPEPPPDPGEGRGPLNVTAYKLAGTTAPAILELVAKGDKNFDGAMKHLLNSDPGLNPDGWAAENSKALELFRKASIESYLPAQEMYDSAVPQGLLDRVREATMRSSLCRKRSVRHD